MGYRQLPQNFGYLFSLDLQPTAFRSKAGTGIHDDYRQL